MNRVAINARGRPLPPWRGAARKYIRKVLKYINQDDWDLSVLFCDNTYIRSLNARFRDRDEATDVLSFVLGETTEEEGRTRFLPGDIVISLETLSENARYFRVSEDEELRRLLIHGILHLDGLDHDTNEPTQAMLRLQEKILAELSGERIIPNDRSLCEIAV
jgi:probable rRNA maturation factor